MIQPDLFPKTRVVFTQGGKGGVAKTEVALSLVSWYRSRGINPVLLDFDIENASKSGLKNFYPEARKLDVHREGALDEFFDLCDSPETSVVLADLGAGAGKSTFDWFDQAFSDAVDASICFTAIGVTTNDAGAVQSVLKWANQLQDQVDYVVVLNEFREPGCAFDYWYGEPASASFTEIFSPAIIKMGARVPEFQAELRNQAATLQSIIEGSVDCPFLKRMKNVMRAKRYQRQMFEGFETASAFLLI